jgi:TP901 family phage tail tape measure protein
MSLDKVQFDILVNSSPAEKALLDFAKTVDRTVSKVSKKLDKIDKSFKEISKSLNKINGKSMDSFSKGIKKVNKNLAETERRLKKINSSKIGGKVGGIGGAGGGVKASGKVGGSWFRSSSIIGGNGAFMAMSNPYVAGAMAIGSVVNNMLNIGSEYEYSMKKVKAVTGASADEFERMDKAIQKMASGSQKSLSDFANAGVYLGMAGLKPDQIEKLLPTVGRLSIGTGTDMDRTADWLTNISSTFGIKNYEGLGDVVASTLTNSNQNFQELAKALEYTGSIAASAGVEISDVNAMLAVMADGGIKGSKGGTAMRSFLLALTAPTKKQKGILDAYGIQTTRKTKDGRTILNDPIEILKSLGTMADEDLRGAFGKVALPAIKALIPKALDGTLKKKDLVIENSSGKAKKMEDEMNNTAEGASKRLSSAWENLSVKLFGSGGGSLMTRLLNKLADVINAIADSSGFQKGVKVISDLFSSIGELVGKLLDNGVIQNVLSAMLKSVGVVIVAITKLIDYINGILDLQTELLGFNAFDAMFVSINATASALNWLLDLFINWEDSLDRIVKWWDKLMVKMKSGMEWAKAYGQALMGDDSLLNKLEAEEKAKREKEAAEKWANLKSGAGNIMDFLSGDFDIVKGFKKLNELYGEKHGLEQTKGNIIEKAGTSEGDAVDTLAKASPLTSSKNELSRSIVVNMNNLVENVYVGGALGSAEADAEIEEKIAQTFIKVVSDFELGMSH